MNNISADNSKDIFNIDIPAFDSGAMATRTVVPDENVYRSEYDAVANKSFISFGVMLLCILIFLFFVFIFKKRQSSQNVSVPSPERRKYSYENQNAEQIENRYVAEEKEQPSYRYNSKKRSSLSTPTSINKCIKSFLENTKEN